MKARVTLAALLALVSVAAVGCYKGHFRHLPVQNNLPPAQRILEPGPGVGGPGPGVIPPPGVQAAAYTTVNDPFGPGGDPQALAMAPQMPSVQVLFSQPEGMHVSWDVGGVGQYDSEPLITPGRTNFPMGGIYRMKLTNVPGRAGVELYPSVEIGPVTPRSSAFLAHNAIPLQFTEEDFDQVLTGNFVTKVIYLPDPEFQELALAGVETLVSTRLDPGMDPIVEAEHRGSILAIIRLGNIDPEMPGAPGAAGQFAQGGPEAALAGGYGPACYEGHGRMASLPGHVAGVTAPQYGMTMSGTPIGLPGPPHIPHGVPAGLQKHMIRNNTAYHIPAPTESIKMDVKQKPGFRYPRPPNRVHVTEHNRHPGPVYQPPHQHMIEGPGDGAFGPDGAYCE